MQILRSAAKKISRLYCLTELALRHSLGMPKKFPIAEDDEGTPVGPVRESQHFPPISAVRDQSFHLVQGALTSLVLGEGLRANAYRNLGIEWRGPNQAHCFQPVYVEDL